MTNRVRGTQTVIDLFFPEKSRQVVPKYVTGHLDVLFTVKSMGFREVLATVVYGMYLDSNYSALVKYYACNPRPLYEKGIKPVLDGRGIPSGQSGPLNVTKGISVLNKQWADGRRAADRDAALGLISILEWLQDNDDEALLDLAADLGKRFDALAEAVVRTQVTLPATTSAARLTNACAELMDKHVWGGAIPQALCGIALENLFSEMDGVKVDGARDSASTTNKTAKKVGDLTVEDENGIQQTYEVTMKKFDEQRINEALQSIRAFFSPLAIPEHFIVKVLCREVDTPQGMLKAQVHSLLGELQAGEVLFEFIDIHEWLALVIADLDVSQRIRFFEDVQSFLNGPRVPVDIRTTWSRHFS